MQERTTDNTRTYQGKREDRSVEAVERLATVETTHPWLAGLVTTKVVEAKAEVTLLKNTETRIF